MSYHPTEPRDSRYLPICPPFHHKERDPIPLVLVPGFMAPSMPGFWGPLDNLQSELIDELGENGDVRKRRVIYVWPGCCSSVHDRACEIYYQIKGGRVDYGEGHSCEAGHDRYGRTYEGLYPEWSSEKPLHFAGHSLGGTTIYGLQRLLSEGFFSKHSSSDWVRSLTSISSPYRGLTFVYLFGALLQQPGRIRLISCGSLVYRLIHLYERFVPRKLQSSFYDFNIDHWGFGKKYSMIECLTRSPWAEGFDNAPYDLTIGRAREMCGYGRERGIIDKKTWYRSFVTSATAKKEDEKSSGFHFPIISKPNLSPSSLLSLVYAIPFFLASYFIGRFRFTEVELEHLNNVSPASSSPSKDPSSTILMRDDEENARDPIVEEDWWENDGVCSKVSQGHPGHCKAWGGAVDDDNYCVHTVGVAMKKDSTPKPGRWHVNEINSMSHVGIAAWSGSEHQATFWREMFSYLSLVDRKSY